MNKKKVSPQDLTVLDGFERDAGIVIGILENSLKTITNWRDNFGKGNMRFIAKRSINDVIKILESFAPFGDAYPQLLRFLTTDIPEFKDKVENGYADIKNQIQKIIHDYGQEPLAVLTDQAKHWSGNIWVDMRGLERSIEILRDDLRFCAKKAREQQKPQEKGGKSVKNKGRRLNANKPEPKFKPWQVRRLP